MAPASIGTRAPGRPITWPATRQAVRIAALDRLPLVEGDENACVELSPAEVVSTTLATGGGATEPARPSWRWRIEPAPFLNTIVADLAWA
jgi:hypothetical protein